MNIECPKCHQSISSENVNVQKDIAHCSDCGELAKLSELLNQEAIARKKFENIDPVKGVEIIETSDGWEITASHRSIFAIFLVPFAFAWCSGVITGFGKALLKDGNANPELILFFVPFIFGALILVSITSMSVFGVTRIKYKMGEIELFMGVDRIGYNRKLRWADIESVSESSLGNSTYISFEGRKRTNFGWGLTAGKRFVVVSFLRSKLGKEYEN